jgi:chemotaxis protein histidine kinase CheA
VPLAADDAPTEESDAEAASEAAEEEVEAKAAEAAEEEVEAKAAEAAEEEVEAKAADDDTEGVTPTDAGMVRASQGAASVAAFPPAVASETAPEEEAVPSPSSTASTVSQPEADTDDLDAEAAEKPAGKGSSPAAAMSASALAAEPSASPAASVRPSPPASIAASASATKAAAAAGPADDYRRPDGGKEAKGKGEDDDDAEGEEEEEEKEEAGEEEQEGGAGTGKVPAAGAAPSKTPAGKTGIRSPGTAPSAPQGGGEDDGMGTILLLCAAIAGAALIAIAGPLKLLGLISRGALQGGKLLFARALQARQSGRGYRPAGDGAMGGVSPSHMTRDDDHDETRARPSDAVSIPVHSDYAASLGPSSAHASSASAAASRAVITSGGARNAYGGGGYNQHRRGSKESNDTDGSDAVNGLRSSSRFSEDRSRSRSRERTAGGSLGTHAKKISSGHVAAFDSFDNDDLEETSPAARARGEGRGMNDGPMNTPTRITAGIVSAAAIDLDVPAADGWGDWSQDEEVHDHRAAVSTGLVGLSLPLNASAATGAGATPASVFPAPGSTVKVAASENTDFSPSEPSASAVDMDGWDDGWE